MEKMSARELLTQANAMLAQTPRDRLRLRFNQESDEVFINFTRDRVRAVSVPVAPNISVRVSPDRSHIFGLHFENFLASLVFEHPQLIGLLDAAESYGQSDDVIMEARRKLARDPRRGVTPASLADDVSELLVATGD